MRITALCVLLAAASIAASAANFSGKWAIESPGRGGRGGASTIITLNQVGKEVTGSISPRADAGTGNPVYTEILGGVVDGGTISFYVWSGQDQPVKTVYKGTAAGEDAIEFSVTGGPAGGGNFALGRGSGGPQKVTARRAK